MAKCDKHIWNEEYVDYCHACEEEHFKAIKNMSFQEWYEENGIKKPKDPITTSVMEDLKLRADRGLQKYNTTLGENNHQNMLQHAYEEALDMAQYLKKEIITLNTIQDLVREYPNDMQLGAKIREKYVRK